MHIPGCITKDNPDVLADRLIDLATMAVGRVFSGLSGRSGLSCRSGRSDLSGRSKLMLLNVSSFFGISDLWVKGG